METLIIGKPKIEKLANRARLCSKISENGKPSYILWFDVDAKYADYLTESADAFVVALLPYDIARGILQSSAMQRTIGTHKI